jgi:hypothetical protein
VLDPLGKQRIIPRRIDEVQDVQAPTTVEQKREAQTPDAFTGVTTTKKLVATPTTTVLATPQAQAALAQALATEPGPSRLQAAEAFRQSWPLASLDDAVAKLGPVDVSGTDTGKVIFKSKATGVSVVFDPHSRYFRIEDPSLSGKRRYLDLDGNCPANIVDPQTGKLRGASQNDYMLRTHFRTD